MHGKTAGGFAAAIEAGNHRAIHIDDLAARVDAQSGACVVHDWRCPSGIGDAHNGGGPIWAIFDAAAVAREQWQPTPPHVDCDAGFFFAADSLEALARKIVMRHQRVPMPPQNLAETVARYNSFVDAGKDSDFGKPTPRYRIEKPPFYAGLPV